MPIALVCDEVDTLAVVHAQYEALFDRTHTGLPLWLKSCKQICSEVLAVFGLTRKFFAWRYVSRWKEYGHWPRPRAMHNPLVFNARVVRNLLTPGEMQHTHHGVGVATREFLRKLKLLQVHDICLETSWFRTRQALEWDVSEAAQYGKWSDFWNGRCWKVQITVLVLWYAEEALREISGVAEKCAGRLVGVDAGEARWEDLEDIMLGAAMYKRRRVVVKRRA
jgi:hypothetical protein